MAQAKGRALKRAIGRGEGCCALGRTVAQVPEDAATDDGGQIDPAQSDTGCAFHRPEYTSAEASHTGSAP